MRRDVEDYRKDRSLFEEMFSEESPPFDEQQKEIQRDMDLGELYKQIGAPNPILSNINKVSSGLKATDYKANFNSQRPISVSNFQSFRKKETLIQQDSREIQNKKEVLNSAQVLKDPLSSSKTLFNMYPEEDPRLVYRKYKIKINNPERTGFANYFSDVDKLIKPPPIQTLPAMGIKSSDQRLENNEKTLIFNSNFESGNLYSAYKVSDNEYDLILQNDINTQGYTQWFFFSVENTLKDTSIKFNILNLMKPKSLFNEGMQPGIFSTTHNNKNQTGWLKDGYNISYFKNNITREGLSVFRSYYTLTFTYTFSYSKDLVYFAHCFPYTYSCLNKYLDFLCQDPRKKQYIEKKILCKTLAQNNCDYLTIQEENPSGKIKDDRPAVILTARQHPGESLSSFIMEGILEFLTSEEEEARKVRQMCIFKIIPMLNPDGVIYGNYRTSLCGKDLNRRWKNPKKESQPTIYYAKQMIKNIEKNHPLMLFCDLHGHSRKKNVFFYGNSNENEPFISRVFPLLLSRISKYFSFDDSRFIVEKSKETTARVALWREFKFANVFTLEASFHGYTYEGETFSFAREDYINVGRDFCRGLSMYLTSDLSGHLSLSRSLLINEESTSLTPIKNKKSQRCTNLSTSMIWAKFDDENKLNHIDRNKISVSNIINELKNNKSLVNVGLQSDDSGSDSDPSGDELSAKELKKIFCSRSKSHSKQLKIKLKSDRKKINIQKKIIKQMAEPKSERCSAFLAVKEDKDRASPTRSTPFRIKNFERIPLNKDINRLRSPTALDRPNRIDESTQTEEKIFPPSQEQAPDSKTAVFSLNHARPSSRSFNSNIVAIKNINAKTNLGSLILFNQNSFTMQPSPFKHGENSVFLKGSRIGTERRNPVSQTVVGRQYTNRGTSTDTNLQTKPDCNLYKSFSSWRKVEANHLTQEKTREILISNQDIVLNEKNSKEKNFVTQDQITLKEKLNEPQQLLFSQTLSTEPQDLDVTLEVIKDKPILCPIKFKRDDLGFRMPKKSIKIIPKDRNLEEKELIDQGFFRGIEQMPEKRGLSHLRSYRRSSTSEREENTAFPFFSGSIQTNNKADFGSILVNERGNKFHRTLTQSDTRNSCRPGSALDDKTLIKTAIKLAKEMKSGWKQRPKSRNDNFALLKSVGNMTLTPKKSPSDYTFQKH